jgi:plastocyanin
VANILRARIEALLLPLLLLPSLAQAQLLEVTAHIEVDHRHGHGTPTRSASDDVVVWLTPEQGVLPSLALSKPGDYTLTQHGKQFIPHLLVVRTGSSVDFPNLDPFYHNVFSLFNGKRFDLGLYESHSTRSVRFDRDGVSYIFCNIHPEMGAVVISLSTPYFGVSAADGGVSIRDVPPGSYRLNIWAENVPNDALNALSRSVEITPRKTDLGFFHLLASGDMMSHHTNKFGDNYNAAPHDPY